MSSLLVTGTIGIDSVETPHGRRPDVLGGSASYFSFAAALFTRVRLVGVVGDDFPDDYRRIYSDHAIDTAGLEVRAGAKSFRWSARYHGDMSTAETLRTDLNVLEGDSPSIPDAFRDSRFVFLANYHPIKQLEFLEQLSGPELIVADTMNLWIETARDELLATLRRVTGLVINDGEARLLTGRQNLIDAGQAILELGPKFVVIKKGEHGSMLVSPDDLFALPAFPTREVRDPTGAGDSFACGMMGYLAAGDRFDASTLRAAIARGTVVASFTIEGFSLDALRCATPDAVEQRLKRLRDVVRFS
ncbi:MAG: PfkB family carbohydrate kinase [Phycisphaerae bacterium]